MPCHMGKGGQTGEWLNTPLAVCRRCRWRRRASELPQTRKQVGWYIIRSMIHWMTNLASNAQAPTLHTSWQHSTRTLRGQSFHLAGLVRLASFSSNPRRLQPVRKPKYKAMWCQESEGGGGEGSGQGSEQYEAHVSFLFIHLASRIFIKKRLSPLPRMQAGIYKCCTAAGPNRSWIFYLVPQEEVDFKILNANVWKIRLFRWRKKIWYIFRCGHSCVFVRVLDRSRFTAHLWCWLGNGGGDRHSSPIFKGFRHSLSSGGSFRHYL